MPEIIADLFLSFSHDRLQLLGTRATDCVGRPSNEQLWTRTAAHQNAIGNLVLSFWERAAPAKVLACG